MSSYKSILFHMHGSEHCATRLQTAVRLARSFDAHLTVLYAVMPQAWMYPGESALSSAAAAALSQTVDERGARARAIFDGVVGTDSQHITWAEAKDLPEAAVTRHAYYADLVVLGQRDPSDPASSEVPHDFVESVVMDSGKPAVVIPHIGAADAIGRVALVAWKETRESARAVAASLPLLQRAERVEVATWGEPSAAERAGSVQIETFLRRHGVNARFHHQGNDSPQPGEYMLSLASDVSADLLVMGCYGHSRARELILGGATRTVLSSMTAPVLMAH